MPKERSPLWSERPVAGVSARGAGEGPGGWAGGASRALPRVSAERARSQVVPSRLVDIFSLLVASQSNVGGGRPYSQKPAAPACPRPAAPSGCSPLTGRSTLCFCLPTTHGLPALRRLASASLYQNWSSRKNPHHQQPVPAHPRSGRRATRHAVTTSWQGRPPAAPPAPKAGVWTAQGSPLTSSQSPGGGGGGGLGLIASISHAPRPASPVPAPPHPQLSHISIASTFLHPSFRPHRLPNPT